MFDIDPDYLGPLVSSVAALASWLAYWLNQRMQPIAQASKLMDRMYELDKLVLQYPDDFAAFMAEARRQNPYFSDLTVKREARYFRLKSIVYFHLNIFEEIYLATLDRRMNAQFEGEHWQSYILGKMRHALIKEVFRREGYRIYKGKFSEFIAAHSKDIDLPCDPDSW
jgi:hypothetical protein